MAATLYSLCASSVVLAVTVLLVFHKDYDDGLFGRTGLSLIALAALGRILGAVDAIIHLEPVRISWIGLVLWTGIALFMARHAHRFVTFRRVGKPREWDAVRK